ncbi:transcriptional regulator, GntR family [Burkholderia thailandensis E264]|uniref:Transcriptional regulator, GntR family n=1 Tax=Burkholderia thailandensis (strain ATCC 700388 / DSM 13276 / CCUG 48851 / CIP 106301 / E264) TaxID=271848 RepID=Q2SUS3_BURTA|nr:transcriptional regulator, GntR family [Burkholderia thailandensis E264]
MGCKRAACVRGRRDFSFTASRKTMCSRAGAPPSQPVRINFGHPWSAAVDDAIRIVGELVAQPSVRKRR